MRFDDSLKTVLSADMQTGFGAQSTWRQLVDLMGRGRIAADEPAIARLRLLRQAVPANVRAASARALAYADPGARLVGLFAEDELAIAAPVLRMVSLSASEWLDLLPRLSPTTRSVLRHRRDLPPEVTRGLESFGKTDFMLPQPASSEPAKEQPRVDHARTPEVAIIRVPAETPLSETPFLAVGDVARGLPLVAEAFRQSAEPLPGGGTPRFEISDLVARIDAFNRDRTTPDAPAEPAPVRAAEAGGFRYETDASGVIRWIDGVSRGALIGVSLAYAARQGEAALDGIAAGAFRRRSKFLDARLEIGGLSDAAGAWRVSGMPVFDHATGRFTGFRGTARRPRRDETAEVERPSANPVSDSLRQLVHELRTPTNAIAGFAELIETQLLGPVSPTYRERATAIRMQAADLLSAIEDLDTAARIEGDALELRPTTVAVLPLLERVVADLEPLARLRGAAIRIAPAPACEIAGDERAIERLIARLLAVLVSASRAGESVAVVTAVTENVVTLYLDRPTALGALRTDTLLTMDINQDHELVGAPLLGTGFALRLTHNLATELGGDLVMEADRLTLRLPAAISRDVEQASDRAR